MKKIHSILAIAALLLSAACSKEAALPEKAGSGEDSVSLVHMTFSAVSAETKTSISGVKVNWAPGDVIGIIDNLAPSVVHQFTTDISSESATADFSGEVSEGATEFYAVYPYDAAASADFSAGTVSTSIAAEQSLKAGSGSALVTVCKADGNSLTFHHACGIVAVTLKGSDNINRIILRGNAGEKISGSATLTVSGASVSTAVSGSGYLVDAAPASGSSFTDGTYYLAVAPQTLSSGITVHLFRTDNSEADGSVSSEVAFESGKGFDLGTVSPAATKYKASVGKGQTDVYVSPDGSEGDGTGSDASNPMPFSRFTELMNYGDEKSGDTTYSLYAYKNAMLEDRTFHFAEGTYNLSKRLSTYCNDGNIHSSTGMAFTLKGDSGAEKTIFDANSSCPLFYINSHAKVTLDGLTLKNGKNGTAQGGGAIYINGSRGVTVKNCIFDSNKTSGQYGGGAVRITANASYPASFTGCTFKNSNSDYSTNTAQSYGGAVSLSGNGVASFTSCDFTKNETGAQGGAVYIGTNDTSCTISFDGCTFSENSATTAGGAVSVGQATNVKFTGTNTFSGNTATTNGGAINIAAVAATVSISGGAFSNNSATTSGGAIYIPNTANANVSIDGASFTGNHAKDSGVFGTTYTSSSASTNMTKGTILTVDNCSFSKNYATGNGGISYIAAGYQKYNNCVFDGNYGKTGGLFYCGTGALWVNACSFNDNYATTTYNSIYASSENNGIALVNNSTFKTTHTGGTTDIHTKCTAVITNCTIVSSSSATVLKSEKNKGYFAGNIIKATGAIVDDTEATISKGYNIYSGADSANGDEDATPALNENTDTDGRLWYSWDGSTTFTKPTAAQIKAIIEAATLGSAVKTQDADILTDYTSWLADKGGFTTDIRGGDRTSGGTVTTIWPGSYQN